ncbi:glycosyl transferase family 90-domain-containing protein [Mycena maculata]|uniref:Glycosyl transferase family 90-domain-containing protein n=1 Tax=Mycena maculata TaxID=230809 RepID=A0AAD7J6H2_9AGAR|nr:glycosyl transferase family 90-domain-containing protein [Mycena maculata]
MAYDPESTPARPLLALASPQHGHRRRSAWTLARRPRVLLLVGALALLAFSAATAFFGPPLDIPVPKFRFGHGHEDGGYVDNPPPPPHDSGDSPGRHPRPPPSPAPLDAELPPSVNADNYTAPALAAVAALRAAQPALAAARARYTLKTGRPPPRGFDAFVAFAQERNCLVDAYAGVHADFAPFWALERQEKGWFRRRVEGLEKQLLAAPRGMIALRVHAGAVHKPDYWGSYFDDDWRAKIGQFAAHLPDLTVVINGRDEPRVVFDVAPLLESSLDSDSTLPLDPDSDSAQMTKITELTALHDATPFALAPPSTASFFASKPGCGGPGGGAVSFLRSSSSAEFTTDLYPVLSMAKIRDVSSGNANANSAHTCFADVLVPGEFYYRNSWWAGKFAHPDNVPWGSKVERLYWRGKSNGGHIRGANYRAFPRFRLMDIARRPQHADLFDVRITSWHESHCTDECDAAPIVAAYNITGEVVPREEAYRFKYLLDVDGNTFSGRYLGLLRSGGLVFKSTAFTEFFTPWLVPYEHYIPVRPDLADLVEKVEWARANDGEARRIQESGRVFAEHVLTDAQNDCYWFAVLLEWGALWGEGA